MMSFMEVSLCIRLFVKRNIVGGRHLLHQSYRKPIGTRNKPSISWRCCFYQKLPTKVRFHIQLRKLLEKKLGKLQIILPQKHAKNKLGCHLNKNLLPREISCALDILFSAKRTVFFSGRVIFLFKVLFNSAKAVNFAMQSGFSWGEDTLPWQFGRLVIRGSGK